MKTFSSSHACSRGHGTGDTLQLHKARIKARASSMPVYNRCNVIKNRSFISSHACTRGHGTEDTLQLHKARTKARASSMPVHNRCNEIKKKTQHLLGATHAAEATTQETHCNFTRHVPRSVPRPWPCTTGFNKNKYIRYNCNNTLRHPTTKAWHYIYPYSYYNHTI